MEDPTPTEVVQASLDALLQVVAKSSEDLHVVHDLISTARLAPLPPSPRATVLLAERVIEHLTKVDIDLREVLLALGLAPSFQSDNS